MSQNIFCANDHAVARGLSLKYPLNTGMNAAPSAPSPDNRRIKLGMPKTRTSESAAGDVPSRRATRWSR